MGIISHLYLLLNNPTNYTLISAKNENFITRELVDCRNENFSKLLICKENQFFP